MIESSFSVAHVNTLHVSVPVYCMKNTQKLTVNPFGNITINVNWPRLALAFSLKRPSDFVCIQTWLVAQQDTYKITQWLQKLWRKDCMFTLIWCFLSFWLLFIVWKEQNRHLAKPAIERISLRNVWKLWQTFHFWAHCYFKTINHLPEVFYASNPTASVPHNTQENNSPISANTLFHWKKGNCMQWSFL